MSKFVVCLKNANSPSGCAYLGGNGCNGFDTDKPEEAHKFDEFDATRFADHWRGQWHGFHGGADIAVIAA